MASAEDLRPCSAALGFAVAPTPNLPCSVRHTGSRALHEDGIDIIPATQFFRSAEEILRRR
jgi:hypothetical protein